MIQNSPRFPQPLHHDYPLPPLPMNMASVSVYPANGYPPAGMAQSSLSGSPNSSSAASLSSRPSRLSSLNPMRSSKQLPPPPAGGSSAYTTASDVHTSNGGSGSSSSAPQQQQQQQQHQGVSLGNVNQGYHSLFHHDEENFKLTRIESNHSLGSTFSTQSHYKVALNFSKRDIELVRYTWNKMLLDEPIVEKKSVLPQMPGQFPIESEIGAGHNKATSAAVAGKSLNFIKQTSASTIASSLFCRQLYGNLLQMEPKLEGMFPSIKHQAVAFAGVMSLAISQLENISSIDDYLMKLGKRHTRILSIEAPHFELMGEALIQTFHERFGQRFNQDLEILWIKLYMYLSNSILQYGMDPKLKLNRLDNTGTSHDHLFESSKLDSEENLIPDNYSMIGQEPATRTTTYSNGVATDVQSSTMFSDRKTSVSTQQTSILTPSQLQSNNIVPVEPAKEKKKKSRTSIRSKTRENCIIM